MPGKQKYIVDRYDAGILAVTDSRLLFAGDKSTFNIYLDEIIALRRQPHADGNLLAMSACTLPVPIFFGYVEYWRGGIDPTGESFISALEVTIHQLARRRARVA